MSQRNNRFKLKTTIRFRLREGYYRLITIAQEKLTTLFGLKQTPAVVIVRDDKDASQYASSDTLSGLSSNTVMESH